MDMTAIPETASPVGASGTAGGGATPTLAPASAPPAGALPATDMGEAEGTPAALLAAGRKLFARCGYEGASVRAITAEAGANLGAITYHFGSKKTLYNRVVEGCVAPLAARVEAALARPLPVLDRLELVVRAYFDHFAENPELPQLMLQEVVLGGGPPEAAGPTMRRIYGMILEAIREGQAAGEIRAGDPELMVLTVISQPVFPMLVRQPIKAIAGRDVQDPATREQVAAHVAAVARAALEKREES